MHRAKKQGRPPEEYLRRFASAAHLAAAHAGGLLEPLYSLHAARLKLLDAQLSSAAAVNLAHAASAVATGGAAGADAEAAGVGGEQGASGGAAEDGGACEDEAAVLKAVGQHRFLPPGGSAPHPGSPQGSR